MDQLVKRQCGRLGDARLLPILKVGCCAAREGGAVLPTWRCRFLADRNEHKLDITIDGVDHFLLSVRSYLKKSNSYIRDANVLGAVVQRDRVTHEAVMVTLRIMRTFFSTDLKGESE